MYTPKIYSDLIVSAIDFEKATISISNGKSYTVLLKEKENNLQEVNIRPSKDDLKKWGDLFLRLLLGADSHYNTYCKIVNPQDLRFYFDDIDYCLEVSLNAPLLIENSALGYLLHLDIDEFKYYFNRDELKYYSSIYYTKLEAKRNKNIPFFEQSFYLGSKMHFYRSLYTGTLEQQGFVLYKYKSIKNLNKERVSEIVHKRVALKMAAGAKREDIVKLSDDGDSAKYYKKVMQEQDVLKWDTVRVDYKEFVKYDSLKKKILFKFQDTLMLVYKKNNSQVDNLIRKNPMPSTQKPFTEFKTLIFLTNNEGMTIDPAGFGIQNILYMIGYMGNRRLSEQLPYDYAINTIQ